MKSKGDSKGGEGWLHCWIAIILFFFLCSNNDRNCNQGQLFSP